MGKCSKDKRDIFYRQAKEEGWRARSAFKLMQIDEQYAIFEDVTRAVDLCAAPGSWSQVLARKIYNKSKNAKIVAVDIQTMAPIEGVTIIQGDITTQETVDMVIDEFKGLKAELVVCDGAPDVTGHHDLDEFIQAQLLDAALGITSKILQEGGTFVAKIFRVNDIVRLINSMRLHFVSVTVIKPKSSRQSSIEAFIICRNFRPNRRGIEDIA